MNQHRKIEWLYEQLPELVAKGVLTADAAAALKQHYALERGKSGMPWALLFFGALGALLIGAGIILLLAHNWQDLGRPMRTVLSLSPLVVAQAITGWVLWRGRAKFNPLWCEPVGIFHSLAVAASIALIAQTYHMPGTFDSFLIAWMLLSLPLVYLLKAVAPLMIYLAGITAWALYQQRMGLHAFYYWPLLALAAPFVWSTVRAAPFSPRSALVQWSGVIAITCGLGFALGRGLPGLWIPLYASLFGVLYLAGGLAQRPDVVSGWLRPARLYGGAASLILVFILSWEWPWNRVGWHYWNTGRYTHIETLWVDGLVGLALLGALLLALVVCIRRKHTQDLLLGSAAPLVALGYVLASVQGALLSMLLMNLYLMVAGIGLVIQGVRELRLRIFNVGMGIFSALVVIRFFDSDLSFIVKGLVFIAVGVAFLLCNVFLYRRKEALS